MTNFGFIIGNKRCAATLGAAFLFVAILLLLPGGVHAATVTPRIEISGNPGETVVNQVKLYNEERTSKTYYISYYNFGAQDESGNPVFIERKEDLATWMQGPAKITIGPGEAIELPIKINIPTNAEPGGHFASIFFQTNAPDKEGQLALNARLGSLVILRVNGDFTEGATILEFATQQKKKVFNRLPVSFYYRFQNIGEDYVKPVGDIVIKNSIGRTSKILSANPREGGVLPKSVRRFESIWAHGTGGLQEELNPELTGGPSGFWNTVEYQFRNFALGKYTATLKVVYGSKELQSANASYTFYVFPWQLVSMVAAGLIIIFFVGRFLLRRYNRYIIAKAATKSGK